MTKKGLIDKVTIVRDIGAGCGEEALKAVKIGFGNPFEAAILAGNRVKVRFDVPVRFRLE